jgi:hypothetical protein
VLSESSDVRIGTHLEKWDRKFTISSLSGFIVFLKKERYETAVKATTPSPR